MGTYTGRTDNVPKQLKAGMAVVVWIKPEYPLVGWEENTKLTRETWLKGEIEYWRGNLAFVCVKGILFSTIMPGLIIIRSTSLADNVTYTERDRLKRIAAKQRKRELAKAVK